MKARASSTLVKQREDFRGKRIVIAGGGDSAVDWTLLAGRASRRSIYVIHRRPKFRAAPESVAPHGSAGQGRQDRDGGALSAGAAGGQRRPARRRHGRHARRAGAPARGRCAAALLRPGHESRARSPNGASTSTSNHITVDPATCATSQPGIFAIGDIATYPGKLKLILSRLLPRRRWRPMPSTRWCTPARCCISNIRRRRRAAAGVRRGAAGFLSGAAGENGFT